VVIFRILVTDNYIVLPRISAGLPDIFPVFLWTPSVNKKKQTNRLLCWLKEIWTEFVSNNGAMSCITFASAIMRLWLFGRHVTTCLCYLAPPTDTPTHPSPSIIHIPRHFRNRRKHALRNRIEQSSYCGRRRATMFQLERIDRCVRRLSPCSHQKTPSIHRRIDGSPALLAPNLYLSPSAAHPVMLISDSVWRSPAATSLSFSFRRSDAWWEWYKVSYLYLSGFGFISLRVICKLTDKSQKHIYKKNYN